MSLVGRNHSSIPAILGVLLMAFSTTAVSLSRQGGGHHHLSEGENVYHRHFYLGVHDHDDDGEEHDELDEEHGEEHGEGHGNEDSHGSGDGDSTQTGFAPEGTPLPEIAPNAQQLTRDAEVGSAQASAVDVLSAWAPLSVRPRGPPRLKPARLLAPFYS